MANDIIRRLPTYPSSPARKALSPSQLSTLNQTIASSLQATLALPPEKRDTANTPEFLSTYASDTALQVLQDLIWKPDIVISKDERLIQKQVVLLAQKMAESVTGLDIQTLLDLSIIYFPSRISQIRLVFAAAIKSTPIVVKNIEHDVVPAFTLLLSQQNSQGLYGIRKASHCILAFLRSSPPEIIHFFATSKPFILALADLYDRVLVTVAQTYGGVGLLRNAAEGREPDDWERIWIETKVALMDSFHVLLSYLLEDLAGAKGTSLAFRSEKTFDIIFALLEAPSSSTDAESTPFLNRPLLADYQQSYSLSKTLAKALKHAEEKDARLDVLESMLGSLDTNESSSSSSKDPGVLKILLRSSGIKPGIDYTGMRSHAEAQPASSTFDTKGKAKATFVAARSQIDVDPDLDLKATQVLDIFPDLSIPYVRLLLGNSRYGGNPEKVIEALLDGTAEEEELIKNTAKVEERGLDIGENVQEVDIGQIVRERQNVWDEEEMDMGRLRIGKKSGDITLQDRSFIEQMKADILRRAEAISDDEDNDEFDTYTATLPLEQQSKGKMKSSKSDNDEEIDLDLDDSLKLKVSGDGEDSEESDSDNDEGHEEKESPETILELAYIRDPKLFDRDSGTRKSKGRAELKSQTGWDDSQIEGWRIMLERNPKKDKILQKHEFSGNQQPLPVRSETGPSSSSRGRGRGGRGGGRGRGGRGGTPGEPDAREKAWKDKNKASRANHNRKRGHDKKMARAGAGVPPT